MMEQSKKKLKSLVREQKKKTNFKYVTKRDLRKMGDKQDKWIG